MTSGVLTVTHGIVDLSVLSWAYNNVGKAWASDDIATLIKKPPSNDDRIDAISDVAPLTYYAYGFGRDRVQFYANTNGRLYVNNASDSITPTGHIVYLLATPLTYQLTPQQIATLHPGINYVWADCGPIIELIS